jgi:hypothetical protein
MIGRRRTSRNATSQPAGTDRPNDGEEHTPDSRIAGRTDTDPYTEAAATLAATPNPVAAIAVVLGHLLNAEVVTEEDLLLLGIDSEAVEAIREAFDNNNSIDELAEDLETAAHLRGYRRVLGELSEEVGVARDEERRDVFKQNLTGFALENDIEDLRLAYRLMRLERPDLLP